MRKDCRKRALASVALGALVAAPASGALADTASEIRALKARLMQLEAQVAQQAKEAKEAKAAAKHATNVANAAHGKADHHAPPPVFVSFKNGLFVETEDKDFSFNVGGRVHADGGWQTEPAQGDASNVLLRRARLDIQGKAFKYWYYRTAFEFGGGSGGASSANVRDAWLGFKYPILSKLGLGYEKDIFIQLGNQLRPHGLEALSTSNSGTTFIERAMMSDIFNTPRRHLGVSVAAGDKQWGVRAGLYGGSPQDTAIRPNRDGLGQYWEVAGRGVILPIRTEEDLVHFGVSGRYFNPGGASGASNDELLVGRGVRSEANALNTRLLGTPDLSCNPGQLNLAGSLWAYYRPSLTQVSCLKKSYGFNAEFVAIHGPFSVQAEYARAYYSMDPATSFGLMFTPTAVGATIPATFRSRLAAGQGLWSSAAFDGWYAQVAAFLTGETRITGYTDLDHNVNTPYSFSTQPKILKPVSKGGFGALEVAARWSGTDLNSGVQTPASYLPAFGALGFFPGAAIPANFRSAVLIANSAGITGGRVNKLTLGLNWYPEKGYRLLFNYGRVMSSIAPFNQPWLQRNHTSTFLVRAEAWW